MPLDQVTTSSVQVGSSIFISPLPILSAPLVAAVARVYVAVTGSNLDIGVYRSDGVTLTLLSSTGSTVVGTALAIQAVNLLTPVTLQPGVSYFVGVGVNSATPALGCPVALTNVAVSTIGPVIEYGRKTNGFPIASAAATLLHASDLTTVVNVFWVRLSPT